MLADQRVIERIPGYCALCISRCGSIAVVKNGRFVALEPDPSHPTGHALCAKSTSALVDSYPWMQPDGANLNLNAAIDPVSGSVPPRAYPCQIPGAPCGEPVPI